MSDRISPPTWTEWTRNPSERSPQRKAFDDILGALRKEGLIEVRGSLFVHLARYSYLHVKNARISVARFIESVPESVIQQVPPAYRPKEIDGVLRILLAAGLIHVEEEGPNGFITVVLTERQSAGEAAKGQEIHTVLTYLRRSYDKWDAADLTTHASSFPTVESVCKATGVDRALLVPGDTCTAAQDRPDSNDTNPNPFLQETLDAGQGPLALLQFWPLPDQKSTSSLNSDPEFSVLMPSGKPLTSLVREHCIPVLAEFFRQADHRDAATEIQTKYVSYMHKYREKFTSKGGLPANDRIDKILATADPDGESFANAVYVVAQVLRALARNPQPASARAPGSLVVYQAARIAYAHAMAQRVRKRQSEKEAANRTQDAAALLSRLRESPRPLSVEDLKKTPDASKNKEIGAKYPSVLELLPLATPKDGTRPLVFEIRGLFVHRENLLKVFLDLRERESVSHRERLARLWAQEGIPLLEYLVIADRDVSAEFLKAFELILQERILASNIPEFLKAFVTNERDLYNMAGALWPEGHRGAVTPLEVVTRGLDPILWEDREHVKRRPLVGVLGLAPAYPAIVKNAWNIVLREEGVFRYILRKLMAFFGGTPKPKKAPEEAPAKRSSSSSTSGSSIATGPDPRAQKAADLKRLKDLAPILKDRESLVQDREKSAAQWCLKLDAEAGRRTRQAVDDEVARLVNKIAIDQLSEENGPKVALFLVEKSSVLEQVTSSRAFHRYLYLTALLRRSEMLSR